MPSFQDVILPDRRFEVHVVPLVRRREPFVALVETKTPLLQKHLDATQLSGAHYIENESLNRVNELIEET